MRLAFNDEILCLQNVKGENLQPCCFEPLTGFYRDGYCRTGPGDHGVHTVCVVVNQDFLNFQPQWAMICLLQCLNISFLASSRGINGASAPLGGSKRAKLVWLRMSI